MNERIKKLFTITSNNRVVAVETNLKGLVDLFRIIEPNAQGYLTYYNKFKEQKEFSQVLGGKEYFFQQILP